MNYQYMDSPVGRLRLVSNGAGLVKIEFEGRQDITAGDMEKSDRILRAAISQLQEIETCARISWSSGTVFARGARRSASKLGAAPPRCPLHARQK